MHLKKQTMKFLSDLIETQNKSLIPPSIFVG
jgi:hypothetical protein